MSEMLRFECPQCHKTLSAKPQFIGRSTRCPGCLCIVKVPFPEVETEDAVELEEVAESTAMPPQPRPPVSSQYSAIPPNYTPDGFRALLTWFERLTYIFLASYGLWLALLFLTLVQTPLVHVGSIILFVCFLIASGAVALSGIASFVLQVILLYRFWWLIQNGKVRTTPARACWFLGIPFFNYYWMYVAFVGLAEDMNRYCDERQIPAPRIQEEQAVAMYVVCTWGLIPYVNFIAGPAAIFLLVRQVKQWTDVAIAILKARSNRVAV